MFEYKAEVDSGGKWYAHGPGNGNSYYGGVLYPNMRLSDEANARAACQIADAAYAAGYEAARSDVRKALGL